MDRKKALWRTIQETKWSKGQWGIWWLGQMGLALKLGETILLVDPYLTAHENRLVPPLLDAMDIHPDYIIGTHDHLDHIDREAWAVMGKEQKYTRFLVPEYLLESLPGELGMQNNRFIGLKENHWISLGKGVEVRGILSAHEWAERQEGTGFPFFMGVVIRYSGYTLYHGGDTCLYEGIWENLRQAGPLHMMCLPINGRDAIRWRNQIVGNMTYQEAGDLAGALQPDLVLPGHYDMFAGNQEDPATFQDYLNSRYPGIACRIMMYEKGFGYPG